MTASSPRVDRAEPVAIVAAGVVTPIGGDLDAFWSGLLTGADGISTIERFPVADLKVSRGGEVRRARGGAGGGGGRAGAGSPGAHRGGVGRPRVGARGRLRAPGNRRS